MCKESQGQKDSNAFVRLVNGAPFSMMVLAYDWTLDDLVRFCTGPREYAIFGVDHTLALEILKSLSLHITTCFCVIEVTHIGKSPCLIGPLFVHLKKDFAAYHFFASSLISLRSSLSKLKCFGSDGKDALVKAFSTAFSSALHLRCFLHFEATLKRNFVS